MTAKKRASRVLRRVRAGSKRGSVQVRRRATTGSYRAKDGAPAEVGTGRLVRIRSRAADGRTYTVNVPGWLVTSTPSESEEDRSNRHSELARVIDSELRRQGTAMSSEQEKALR